MCFAPQRHVLFQHLNFQKCSDTEVLWTFWLRNVLRARTPCTFWTSQLPKVLRTCGVFKAFWLPHLLRATMVCKFSSLIPPDGSASAALASLLFDPPEPQIIGKTQWICAPASSFFWLFLFSDLLSSSLLFFDSSHLCFASVHIVGSLTSKLPSNIRLPLFTSTYSNYSHTSTLWKGRSLRLLVATTGASNLRDFTAHNGPSRVAASRSSEDLLPKSPSPSERPQEALLRRAVMGVPRNHPMVSIVFFRDIWGWVKTCQNLVPL